jgi:hypothetical protein
VERLNGTLEQGEGHLIASAGIVVIAISAGLLAVEAEPERPAKPFTREQLHLYEAEVKPILARHCLKCHGGGPKIRGGFRLNSRDAVLRGGDLGPAALPGDPAQSLLIKAINYRELEMPPEGKLPAAEIAVLTRWVKEGLPWTPDARLASAPTADRAKDKAADNRPAKPAPVDGWSLRPVHRPAVPRVKRTDWCRTPIDLYVLAKL